MSTINKTGKVAAISIALTFVAQPLMLAAIDKSCITGAEVDALMTVYAPELINTAVKQCSVVLKKDSYLLQNKDSLIAKFTGKRAAAVPLANRAIQKLMKDSTNNTFSQALAGMKPDTVIEVFGTGMISSVKLDTKTCLATNEIIATLAPLPPENLTQLSTILVQLSMDASKKKPLNSCPFTPGILPIAVGSP